MWYFCSFSTKLHQLGPIGFLGTEKEMTQTCRQWCWQTWIQMLFITWDALAVLLQYTTIRAVYNKLKTSIVPITVCSEDKESHIFNYSVERLVKSQVEVEKIIIKCFHMWSVFLKAFHKYLSWFVNDPGRRQLLLVDCEDVVFIQSWSSFLLWLFSNMRTFLLWVVLLNCCWHRKTGGSSLIFSAYKNNNSVFYCFFCGIWD